MTITPCWARWRRRTWAGVFAWALAIFKTSWSSSNFGNSVPLSIIKLSNKNRDGPIWMIERTYVLLCRLSLVVHRHKHWYRTFRTLRAVASVGSRLAPRLASWPAWFAPIQQFVWSAHCWNWTGRLPYNNQHPLAPPLPNTMVKKQT